MKKKRIGEELEEIRQDIEEKASYYGLDFFETVFEMVDYDKISELAAYTGFPTRYYGLCPGWGYFNREKGGS